MPLSREESKLERAIRESKESGAKRIALINPPSFFLTDDRVFFSLGLLSVAGVAQEAGHKVTLFDLAGYQDYEKRACDIAQGSYDIYGVTATSPQYSYAVKINSAIKSAHPHARVVIGGPHATMFADLRKKRLAQFGLEDKVYESDVNFRSLELFDQVIEGEELGIFEALKALDQVSPQKWVYSGTFDNLDELPFLPRELIDMNSYLFKDDGHAKFEINGGPATSIISQRGCPFNCNFCSGRNIPQYRFIKSKETGRIRAYSPERIVAELNYISSQFPQVTRFMFYDDELNIDARTTMRLMEALEENNRERERKDKVPYSFRGFVKSELLVRYPEVAAAMKRAGFNIILSGFESGSDRILKGYIKKNTTTDINYRAAELAFQQGMQVKALTLIGNPTETLDDVRMTESFLGKIGTLAQQYGLPWDFDITILTPYPGAKVYDDAVKNNGKFKDEFQRALNVDELYQREVDFSLETAPYKTAPGETQVHVRTELLSGKDLLELREEIDNGIRTKYNLLKHSRSDPRKDIEHSMGQSS